jgi:hypothetical protein
MVRLRNTLLAIVIGSAMISRSAIAQGGSSSSLTHTVSVTVPPRLKVQVASFAPTSISAVNAGSSTQGLSVNVRATQAWVLSVGSNPSQRTPSMRWSLDSGSGFSKLTSAQVSIASGTLAADSIAATVFFRNVIDNASSSQRDAKGTPVMLTVTAP